MSCGRQGQANISAPACHFMVREEPGESGSIGFAGQGPLPMPDQFEATDLRAASSYRRQAVELRKQALAVETRRLRDLLLRNAEFYERLAETTERRKRVDRSAG